MNSFTSRSTGIELIDVSGVPFNDWEACLKELNTVNTFLGGHAITIQGVKALIPHSNTNISIAEIGCGGGDNLKAIDKWNKNTKLRIHYIGIDINEPCINFARRNCNNLPNAVFINSDYKNVDFNGHLPDIIFSSLFCHHFSNDQLIEMLVWMKNSSKLGFFINDLHRHPAAYHAIKFLTKLFSRSYLVKNDAPISVLRGFNKKEWKNLIKLSEIKNYTINWKWAFRHLIIVSNE